MLAIMGTERLPIASKLTPTVEVWRCFEQGFAGRRVSLFVGASVLAIMGTERLRIASKLAPTVEVWWCFEQGFAGRRVSLFVGASVLAIMGTERLPIASKLALQGIFSLLLGHAWPRW